MIDCFEKVFADMKMPQKEEEQMQSYRAFFKKYFPESKGKLSGIFARADDNWWYG
jgi:hypothetical protein